jgi:hypothetical protein
MKYSIFCLCLLATVSQGSAQSQDDAPDLSDTKREQIVESMAKLIDERYVFPKVGTQIAEHLREQLYVTGAYDDLQPAALGRALTRDLRSVNQDLHLSARVRRPLDPSQVNQRPELQAERRLADARRKNFGFEAVERLEGNIGYLNLRGFYDASFIGETTGGGAHPGETHSVEDTLSVFIPAGRAISPITGSNWEGVGVKPHLPTSLAKALELAIVEALKSISPDEEQ